MPAGSVSCEQGVAPIAVVADAGRADERCWPVSRLKIPDAANEGTVYFDATVAQLVLDARVPSRREIG